MRKILSIIFCFVVLFTLSGCDLMTVDTSELLSPPSLPNELKPIDDIIKQTAGQNYTLKYPSRGEYRSAVISDDVTGDGFVEHFAFYYTSDGENGFMHVNAIVKRDGKWRSVAIEKIVAGGVDKVEFCDLDGDGRKELLVGWEIYGTSEMQLGVYALKNDSLEQLILQKYTHFTCCDLNQDKTQEILLIKTASLEQTNEAALFGFSENSLKELSRCPLDSTSKTISEPIISILSTGKTAVYLEEIKGIGAVTEVLVFEKGKLQNPLYSSDFKETFATLRSVSLSLKDINNDGILEIPIQENVPSVALGTMNEMLYLTNWCSFDGSSLTVQRTAMVNVNDGYSLNIPANLIGKIAILKDTELKERGIYYYDSEELTVGDNLVTFKSFSIKEWNAELKNGTEYKEIMRTDSTVHAYYSTEVGKTFGITEDYIKDSFSLFE